MKPPQEMPKEKNKSISLAIRLHIINKFVRQEQTTPNTKFLMPRFMENVQHSIKEGQIKEAHH